MSKRLEATLRKLRESGLEVKRASEINKPLSFLHTGSLVLDYALGGKGYPVGKMVELYGQASSGKSLLALMAVAEATRQGKTVVYLDLEGNYSNVELEQWRRSFGVDPQLVIDITRESAEDSINALESLLKAAADEIGLVVVDSLGALVSDKMLGLESGEGYIPDNPKLIGNLCRKLNVRAKSSVVLLLNHVSTNFQSRHGALIPKGGHALRHLIQQSLYVKGKSISEGDSFYASIHEIDVDVKKNKISRPGGSALGIKFSFDENGVDFLDDLLTLGKIKGHLHVTANGHWSIPGIDEKIHGREQVKKIINQPQWVTYLFSLITGMSIEEYYGWPKPMEDFLSKSLPV